MSKKNRENPPTGILIIPTIGTPGSSPFNPKNIEERVRNASYFNVVFSLKTSSFKKGYNRAGVQFVTNPKIRELLATSNPRIRGEIGFFEVSIRPPHKKIVTREVYPYEKQGSGKKSFVLKKSGLASFAEFRIERLLHRFFPGFSIRSTSFAMPERKNQLRKRGRVPGEAIPLLHATELTRRYVAQGMRRHWKK